MAAGVGGRLLGGGKKEDADERDTDKQHEGYVLPILAQFDGYADSDDYGRLLYVFPNYQITAEEGARHNQKTSHQSAVPPPIPPPIYEKKTLCFEYGVKGPLVVFLGIFNVFLLYVFYVVGGTEFKAPRQKRIRPSEMRRTMGRRGGGLIEKEGPEDEEIIVEQPAALILFLELFPKLAKFLYKPLVCYAVFFFGFPLIRSVFIHWENKAIERRNAIRKVRAKEALLSVFKHFEERRDRALTLQKKETMFRADGNAAHV